MVTSINLTYEHFNSTKHRKHDAYLVHIIVIFGQNICLAELVLDHLKPLSDLLVSSTSSAAR
jgi:hypothetical protein